MSQEVPMSAVSQGSKGILSPLERHSEIIFGLIMALSITGSVSVAEQGKGELRTMLLGALGCNLAWGIIDALIYFVTVLVERARERVLIDAVVREPDPARACRLIAESLPPLLAEHVRAPELEHLRLRLAAQPRPGVGPTGRDLLGTLGVFLLVFSSTIPVVLPFLLPLQPLHALRLSNAVAVAMLFVLGYRLGRYAGTQPALTGAAAVALGTALVGVTIALGG